MTPNPQIIEAILAADEKRTPFYSSDDLGGVTILMHAPAQLRALLKQREEMREVMRKMDQMLSLALESNAFVGEIIEARRLAEPFLRGE